MNARTDYQTIIHEDRPAFVLVSIADWERVRPLLEQSAAGDGIPQAVLEAHILRDVPLARAWREHFGLTQQEVAERAGMQQSALARLERGETKPRMGAFKRLAGAMGISLSQIGE